MTQKYYKNIFNSNKINGSASLGAADPFLIKVNGYYYLTCTRQKGLVFMKSFDLIKWENVNTDGIVGLDETLKSAYAPEVIYYNGYFYACASPSGNGHYFYKSENIEGPFKRITDNIHELIDGSFFIDYNEEPYFLRATETGIAIKHFKNNEHDSDFDLFDKYFYFDDSTIGNWTEGPYLIKRYGKYYLTFTGTHFLSDAYRVNYMSGNDIKNEKSLKNNELLLISTTKEFYGLGHSMNILAPNLDSYYIAYHNMCPNRNRYLNLSRLVFDKKNKMLVNGVQIDKNFEIERPYFEKFIDGENYLSNEYFLDKSFSIEYNFKSKDIELILGYQDEINYQKIVFINNNITLITVKNNIETKQVLHALLKEYDLDKYHFIRIQYKNNRLALYFDLIELNDKINVKINNGKIGFRNNKLDNSYLAYSKYSFGDSDTIVTKVDKFFLDNMNKNNKKYFTNIYIKENGIYDFYIDNIKDVSMNNLFIDKKQINIRENDHKIIKSIYLKKGKHRISFDLIRGKFNEITYLINNENINLDTNNFINYMTIYGNYLKLNRGIYFENDRNALLTNNNYEYYDVSTDLEIIGNPVKQENVAGLIIDVNNYAKVNNFENLNSYQGFSLLVNKRHAYVIDTNFSRSKILKRVSLKEREINLRIIKEKNKIEFYVNSKLIYKINNNSKYIKGKVGVYMNHASVLFKTFNLYNKEEQ